MPLTNITSHKLLLPLKETLAVSAPAGVVELYWLGQAGFVVRAEGMTLLIDPYLSDALAKKYKDAQFKHQRMMPPPINPEELRGIDFLFSSHVNTVTVEEIEQGLAPFAGRGLEWIIPTVGQVITLS